jgi:inhibitor of cysteine peptidase
MKKKIITALLLASLTVFTGAITLAADRETPADLDGKALSATALIDGTSVWLPVRAVCEALGYSVSWANDGGVVAISAVRDGDRVSIDVTHQTVTQNGHFLNAAVLSGGGVRLLSGRTYMDSGLFSSIFPVGASYDSKTARLTLTSRSKNNMTVVNETVASQTEYLNSMVQYPRLTGLVSAEVQTVVNDTLQKRAEEALDKGSNNAADMAQAIRDGYTGAVGRCETYFDYILTYNQNGLLSVVLSEYQYAGGAHGSTVQTAYTFDLSTGKTLKLGDLMAEKSGYAAVISSAIRKEIDTRVTAGILSEFDFSPFKDIGADPEFYLSGGGLVFYFQQYAYFPYAAGIQEFLIRYQELAPMMNDTYRFLADAPVLLQPSVQNNLTVGAIARVTLDGNPTTGYTWHYTISDGSVLALVSGSYTAPGSSDAVGAGGSYAWDFKALKAGETVVTFKYYRDWEGEASADKTAVYTVTVS